MPGRGRKSSKGSKAKRSAAEALDDEKEIVVLPDSDAPATTAADSAAAPPSADAVASSTTDAPASQIIPGPDLSAASSTGETVPLAAASEDESTLHKAKKLATDAGHSVQHAVHAGMEKASEVIHAAEQKIHAQTHSQAKASEPVEAPVAVPVGQSDATATTAAPSSQPSSMDKAKASLSHAANVVGHDMKVAADVIADKTKSALQQSSAFVASTANQLGAAFKGTTGSEVSRPADADDDIKMQISDASHGREHKDGSLPVERNADEFPHPRRRHESHADSKLHGSGSSSGVAGEHTSSGLGDTAKTDSGATSDAGSKRLDAAPVQHESGSQIRA